MLLMAIRDIVVMAESRGMTEVVIGLAIGVVMGVEAAKGFLPALLLALGVAMMVVEVDLEAEEAPVGVGVTEVGVELVELVVVVF